MTMCPTKLKSVANDLRPYSSYKHSGVPWIGDVPAHWALMPNRALLKLEKQPVGNDSRKYTLLSLTKRGIIRRDMENPEGKFPSSFDTYQIVESGDLVFCLFDIDETPRAVGLSELNGMITGAYTRFKVSDDTSRRFLYLFYLHLDNSKLLKPLYSGLRKVITKSAFLSAKVALPPQSERMAIVRYLEYADRQIRRYVRTKERLIGLLEEEKQAIINQAVTRGLDPSVRLKPSGVEWLGDVPEHWEVQRLKRVLHRLIDCEHKTAPAVSASSYRVVRTSAVRGGSLSIAGTYCTSEKAFAEWTRRGNLEPGDVIFTREAPAGEACVVPSNLSLCLGQRTVLIKVDRNAYDPHFLVHMLYAGPPHDEIELASRGSTVPHFNVEDIGVLPVLTPPVREQTAIVRYLDHETAVIDAAIARARRQVELVEEYRTRLIADVVTGKLDVREAEAGLRDEADAMAEDSLSVDGVDEDLRDADGLA